MTPYISNLSLLLPVPNGITITCLLSAVLTFCGKKQICFGLMVYQRLKGPQIFPFAFVCMLVTFFLPHYLNRERRTDRTSRHTAWQLPITYRCISLFYIYVFLDPHYHCSTYSFNKIITGGWILVFKLQS